MKTNSTNTPKSVTALIKRISLPIAGFFALLAMTSCSTMAGFGRDVENTGEEIQEAAR